jgi:hypothetical protein
MEINSEFLREVRSNEDLLKFLSITEDEFKFIGVHFRSGLDFYEALAGKNIAGIILLGNELQSINSEISKEINPMVTCSNIQFDKKLSFQGCEFDIPLEIKGAIFKKGISFAHSSFEKELNMFKSKAEGVSTFGMNSKSSVLIYDSSFSSINTNHTRINVEDSFHIEGVFVNSGLDFSVSDIKKQLNIIDCKINGSLKLRSSSLGSFHFGAAKFPNAPTEVDELDITLVEFNGQVQFSNLNIKSVLSGTKATFNDEVFLTRVNFVGDASFAHATFHKPIYFEKSSAKNNFSFYAAIINSDINFQEFDYTSANVSFTGAQINANLWLGSLLFNDSIAYTGKLSFLGAIISSTSIVRIFNLNGQRTPAGEIDFSNSLIKGLLDIRNVFVNKVNFDGTLVLGNIQENNSLLAAIKDRNSARILKHEAKRINNTISALSYNKLEMKLYAKTLKFKKFSDWSVLKLNWLSNNYGADWIWGSLFTIIGGLVFYSLFNMSVFGIGFIWEKDYNFILNDEKFWIGFVNYFWLPTGFSDLITENKIQGGIFGGIFFAIGKILIAYGIYQTIAAFRKYI